MRSRLQQCKPSVCVCVCVCVTCALRIIEINVVILSIERFLDEGLVDHETVNFDAVLVFDQCLVEFGVS